MRLRDPGEVPEKDRALTPDRWAPPEGRQTGSDGESRSLPWSRPGNLVGCLGDFLKRLRTSWKHPGLSRSRLERVLGLFECVWGRLVSILERFAGG